MLDLQPPRHTSTLRVPPVHRADHDRLLRVDLTPSAHPRAMTGICAFETFEATSRVDV
jgi:hypothetical protein